MRRPRLLTVGLARRLRWEVARDPSGPSWRVRHTSWLPGTWRSEHFLTPNAALWFVEQELAHELGVTIEELREHVAKISR